MRAARVPQRVAQGGVALGLVLSMGAVVAAADAEPSIAEDVAALVHTATTDTHDARTEQLRAQAVQAAQGVVEQVSVVRSDAEQAAVPGEVLAELDAATAELQAAMQDVDAPAAASDVDRTPNVSRDLERTSAEQGAAPDAAATPQPSADVSAAATDAAAASPSPSASATPSATDSATAAAAPAPGTSSTPAPTTGATGDPIADATLPDTSDPATTPLRAALDRVKQAAEVVRTTTEQKKAEAAAAEAAAADAARVAAEQEAQRAAWKASLQGYANGKIPSSALCGVGFDDRAMLRCDAAEALDALDAAFFDRFGTHLAVSDSYRSYAAQVACRAAKGSLCATPGTSNHGLGVAVDLGGSVQTFGTAQHQWMRENAPAYDWTLPEWARASGSKPEPWHWEYTG